jgi:cytosine/adenosine deaminase-related metal-dependent hydrolase
MSNTPAFTLSARWLFPVEDAPIREGRIVIRDGRIAEIGPAQGRPSDIALGNTAIVPGFVNAHTHLELPSLDTPREDLVRDQIEWLRRVVAYRLRTASEVLKSTVMNNLRASLAAGTTALADVTTAGLSWNAVAAFGLRAVVFCELIGLKRARAMETSSQAFDWLEATRKKRKAGWAHARAGLCPHAPYSTVGWLYERAATGGVPLSTHLAELPEELQLLEQRDGRLRAFLQEIGAWDEEWQPLGSRPADYLRRGNLRQADWLVAHGTYLDESDYWQLRPEAAPAGQRVAIAYCPRTTARFGHAPHPYRAMLERGAVVCLGTDSLASAPSLSILDEMRFLHRADPSLSGQLLLAMATLFGAWALRAEGDIGSLKPGKWADLACIALPDREDKDPYTLILESDLPALATIVRGKFLYRADSRSAQGGSESASR